MEISEETLPFWKTFNEILETALPPLKPGDGEAPERLAAAENRLGFRLPRLLAEYYLLTAKRDFNRHQDSLAALDQIDQTDILNERYMPFFWETQGVAVWAIDLADISQVDPPVWRGIYSCDDRRFNHWFVDNERLSDSLITMLFWTCHSGCADFLGILDRDDEQELATPPGWLRFEHAGESGVTGYWNKQMLVGTSKCVTGCARTEEGIHEIEAAFGIKFEDIS